VLHNGNNLSVAQRGYASVLHNGEYPRVYKGKNPRVYKGKNPRVYNVENNPRVYNVENNPRVYHGRLLHTQGGCCSPLYTHGEAVAHRCTPWEANSGAHTHPGRLTVVHIPTLGP